MDMPNNPFVALHQCKIRAAQVQNQLAKQKPYEKSGILSFGYFKLKREGEELKRMMTDIRRLTHPDIIA